MVVVSRPNRGLRIVPAFHSFCPLYRIQRLELMSFVCRASRGKVTSSLSPTSAAPDCSAVEPTVQFGDRFIQMLPFYLPFSLPFDSELELK